MHRLYIFSIIMNYRYMNTTWHENKHLLQPYTSDQLRMLVSQWIKSFVHIDNKIVYRMPEALLQNKFCISLVPIIYYDLMLVKLCHVWSNIAVPFRQHMYGKAHKISFFRLRVVSSFMDWLCHVRNKIIYVLSSVIFVFISLVASQLAKINTNITLSWALKQFVTRVHTLFSI